MSVPPLKVTEPVNEEEVNRAEGISDIILPGLGPSCSSLNQVGR